MTRPWSVATAAAASLALLMSGAAPATAAQRDPGYFWEWSDGSKARSRTLSEAQYRTQARLPALVVATDPATPGRRVVLQFRDARGWQRDDVGYTDRHGVVRLEVNPYCQNGAWCRRGFSYRLVAGSSSAALALRFVR